MMKANRMSFSEAKNTMLKSLLLAALAVPGVAMAADAPASHHTFTANVGVASDYVFRGVSQTSGKPALQGGIDYAHSSGLYAGVWGSNVSWIRDFNAGVSSNLELDTYFGFKNTLQNEFNYDAGFIRYNYPVSNDAVMTTKADTDEIYFGAGYKWVSAKYSHSLGKFLTVPNAQGTNYIEVNANVPLGDSGVTFGAHAGRQAYRGSAADALTLAGTTATYSDYKLSVSKDFSGYVIALAYTDTNARRGGFYTTPAGKDLARSTGIVSVTRSF